jgi:acyl-CoA thioester hydrolase
MFGTWLKSTIESAGYNQTALAKALTDRLGRSIDRAAVNKMVKGGRKVSADELLAIEEILGITFHKDSVSIAPFNGLSGQLTDFGHRLYQRVYYEDTDFTGVVYHARYLHFFERGRTDYLRLSGIHHAALDSGEQGERLAWVVRRMEIDFKSPARIDDVLSIETRVEYISGARILMRQMILCQGAPLAEATVEAALMNGEGKPRRFPKIWISKFAVKSPGS